MELGKDVSLLQTDRSKATVHFTVLNDAQVKSFLENKELNKFLTDQVDIDKDKSGCRVNLELSSKGILSISRSTTMQTFIHAANVDLLSTLYSYVLIVPKEQEPEWADIVGGMGFDYTQKVTKKSYTRGKSFLLE